ncbi:hypothetical protein EW026_g6987 [Hermanssonia centrifuga]|uniref:RNA-directed DNA polymerase n=1 Tax=Hermanssonia centrifuga TaxID=98765 RepID=A0A4S4K995_9APHY|nr:hypothetical protein EW026_g6987 [Hermanssonia centrifuga]
MTDPRNWGGVNIPAAELDLELQRKALEFYSKYHQGQPLNLPSDLSDEEKDEGIQQVTLDHWEANKLGANPGTALRAASDSAASREEQLLQEVDTLREELHRARLALDAAKGSAEATLAISGKLHSASNARVTAGEARYSTTIPSRKDLYAGKNQPRVYEEGITGEPPLNGERLRPVNQVEPTSCLGRIFNKVAEISPEYPRPGNTEASVPPEDADPSSSDSDNSLGRRVKLSAWKSRHSKNSSRLPTLKPREPDAYHGRPDVHEFHKFVDECSNYVRGYSLTEERYVSTISSFLKGKAYKRGQPPGVASFGVAIDFNRVDDLHNLASASTLDAILCNLMELDGSEDDGGSSENDSEGTDGYTFRLDWERAFAKPDVELPITRRAGRPYVRLGNASSEHASRVLSRHMPYCCDMALGSEAADEDPLGVYQISETHDIIMGRGLVPDIELPRYLLDNPEFNLPQWYQERVSEALGHRRCRHRLPSGEELGDVIALHAEAILLEHVPFPTAWVQYRGEEAEQRFFCHASMTKPVIIIHDDYLFSKVEVPLTMMLNHALDLPNLYATVIVRAFTEPAFTLDDLDGHEVTELFGDKDPIYTPSDGESIELFMAQTGTYPPIAAIQRNAASVKDFKRLIPESIVVVVQVNGHPARALIDSGSMADFLSTKLAHQLRLDIFELQKQLPVHLAVQGSRAKISCGAKADLKYQSVKETRYFDIVNLLNYDMVLGTPFLFQHRVSIGFNPTSVVIGSTVALPIQGSQVRTLESHAADLLSNELGRAREQLRAYSQCIASNDASDTPLPPLREINHRIDLKDTAKVYHWRPSKCPEALRGLWTAKRDAYLRSGRWKMSNARNTCPMLLLTKPGTGIRDVPPRLRTVFDLRERNENTIKVTSPLPDMEGILRRIAKKPYRSSLDGKDAYECIRIEPDHVQRSAVTTPDGNMVSLVLQQGDCNAVATYQTLMNHLFGQYIGVFMDVYLDDILIYSDSLKDHFAHVKIIVDILQREQLYLNRDKLKFLQPELKVLGRIVDDGGIRMDPDKVDSVLHWKPPTNKQLLQAFLGSVGYLADDVGLVRIPMGVLTELVGPDRIFQWTHTHQRAFDEVKRGSAAHLVGDGRVAAFFSAKLSPAQSNYPVHEIEMLAGVESMRRHRDILLGCPFTWVTDHKGLTHLLRQKNLSARQARWIEKISEFNFTVEYLPGLENILPDALSRMYSNDAPGTVRAASEYTIFDDDEDLPLRLASFAITVPVLTSTEGRASQANRPPRRSPRLATPADTGRPETSKEFSKRIKKVVLHGPRAQRPEGAAADTGPTGTMIEAPTPETGRASLEMMAPPELEHNSFINLLKEQSDGYYVPDAVRGRYKEDPFFATIVKEPRQFKNFELANGLLVLREKGVSRLCIPNVMVNERNIRERACLVEIYGTDVRKYCETCSTCKRSKPDNQKPYGLLNPLPVPGNPWEAIGIDFVGPLPISEDRFYDGLAHLWNNLEGCKHKFATFDPVTKEPTFSGPPIPRFDLVPAKYAVAHQSRTAAAGSLFSADDQQQLVVMAAQQQLRQARLRSQGMANQLAKQALRPEYRGPPPRSGPPENRGNQPRAGPSRRTCSCAKVVLPPVEPVAKGSDMDGEHKVDDGHGEYEVDDGHREYADDELVGYEDDEAMTGEQASGEDDVEEGDANTGNQA